MRSLWNYLYHLIDITLCTVFLTGANERIFCSRKLLEVEIKQVGRLGRGSCSFMAPDPQNHPKF